MPLPSDHVRGPARGTPGRRAPLLVGAAGAVLVGLIAFVMMPGAAPRPRWTERVTADVDYAAALGDGLLAFATDDSVLHALELDTGAERWSNANRSIYAALLVEGGRVYAASLKGALVAFDAATGDELWIARNLGYVSAVVRSGDDLIVGRGAGFVALSAKNGVERWRHQVRDAAGAWCRTESLTLADGVAYVAYRAEELERGGRPRRASTTGASSGGARDEVVAQGGVYAADLRQRKKLWFAPLPGPVLAPPLVTDGAVVVGVAAPAGDEVVGLAREDGAVAWRAAGVRGAPQVVDGVVCVERAHEDAARVVGLRAASGETVWERLASGAVPRSLASGGLALFARGATVDALHGTLGTRAWRLELAADVSAPLAAGAGHLAIVTADRRIAVYPLAD